MKNRAQKIRLGVFVLVSGAVFIALIVFFTSQKLFQEKDTYYIAYKDVSVSGLEVGSPVKYLGLRVGTVEDIRIDPKDVSKIIVEVALKPGTPIKRDARAEVANIGITGLKMIEIRGGSKDAALRKPGGYIPAGASITEEITGKAEVIAEKLELVLNNILAFTEPEKMDNIIRTAENAADAFESMDIILKENREALNMTLSNTSEITARLDSTARYMQLTAMQINSVVSSDTLRQILANTRDFTLRIKEINLLHLVKELEQVAGQTNRLLLQMDNELERSSYNFALSMQQLKNTLDNLNEASRKIQQDPSVLIRGQEYDETPDEELDD